MDFENSNTLTLPVLPLRGLVVFPKSLIHFDVGRKKSITAIKKAMETNQLVFLSAQIDASNNEPKLIDLYKTGVVAKVIQIQKLPENTTRIVIEGKYRAKIAAPVFDRTCIMAEVEPMPDAVMPTTSRDTALIRAVREQFERYIEIAPKMAPDIIFKVALCKSTGELADFIMANMPIDYTIKQMVLETLDP